MTDRNYTGRKVQRIRRIIYRRDHGICALCHEYAPFGDGHVDHIIPRGLGGRNTMGNLQWTHARCNLRKGMKGGGQMYEKASEIAPFPVSLPADNLW